MSFLNCYTLGENAPQTECRYDARKCICGQLLHNVIYYKYTYLLYINNVQTIHISIFSYFLRQNLKDTMTRHHYLCIFSDYGNNMMSSINFTFNNRYDNI